MKNMTKKISLLFIGILTVFILQACEKDGPAERAGEHIDNAVDNAKDAVKDAADKAEEQAEKLK